MWQSCAMYNLSAAVADLLPTLERLLSSLRARIVSSDNRRAYVECAAAFNAAAVRVAKSHVSVYIAPLREEAAAFLRDASPSAPDAPPPLSEVLQDALTELSSAFSRDLYSNLLQPVYLSEIGAALDSLVIDSATGRPRLTIAHQRRMQILTDAVRAAFRQRDVSEETVEAAVSRQTAFLTLIDKSDADLLRIREQLTDRALFALVRALLEGRSSTLVPDLAVISAPTGFRHALGTLRTIQAVRRAVVYSPPPWARVHCVFCVISVCTRSLWSLTMNRSRGHRQRGGEHSGASGPHSAEPCTDHSLRDSPRLLHRSLLCAARRGRRPVTQRHRAAATRPWPRLPHSAVRCAVCGGRVRRAPDTSTRQRCTAPYSGATDTGRLANFGGGLVAAAMGRRIAH